MSLLFTPCAPGAQPAALLAALGSGTALPCFPPLPSNICRVWKGKKTPRQTQQSLQSALRTPRPVPSRGQGAAWDGC